MGTFIIMSKLKNIFLMLVAFSVINGTLLSLDLNAEFNFLEFFRNLSMAEPSEMGGIIMRKPSGEATYIPVRFLENNIIAVTQKECGVIIRIKDGKCFMIPNRLVLGNEKIIKRLMECSYGEEQEEWMCNDEYAYDMEGFTLDFIDLVRIDLSRCTGCYHITRDDCKKLICNLSQKDNETINEIYNMIMINKGLINETVKIDDSISFGKLEFMIKHMHRHFVDKTHQSTFFEIIEKTFPLKFRKTK